MNLRFFSSTVDFLKDCEQGLAWNEAENNLILGVCASYVNHQLNADDFLAAVFDKNKFVMAAMRMKPFNLLLTRGTPAAIEIIVNHLLEQKIEFNGVVAVNETSELFTQIWKHKTRRTFSLTQKQGIYKARRVSVPQPLGTIRTATLEDKDLIMKWSLAFALEATPDERGAEERIQRDASLRLEGREFHLLEHNGEPVALCNVGGPTPSGIRMRLVYTPPELRGRGYASYLVAQKTEDELKSGKKFVFLYTDLANPTSNSIYKKMGYEFVAYSSFYKPD